MDRIKPAQETKRARKRIDIAEVITKEDYLSALQSKDTEKEMDKPAKKIKREKENKTDTKRQKRERKPVSSFFQGDNLIAAKHFY